MLNSDQLAQRIQEMTQDAEKQTAEWIFKAIEKTNSVDIWTEVANRLNEKFGTTSSKEKKICNSFS